MCNKVLIPTDGSPFSLKILPAIRQFFDPNQNELILLAVAPYPGTGIGVQANLLQEELNSGCLDSHLSAHAILTAQNPIYETQAETAVEANLKAELLQWVAGLRAEGYTVSSDVRFGEPSAEIIKFIHEEEIDCIALTTHSRTGLSRLLLGSVAEQILRNVSIPLLLLRPTSN